MRSGRKEVTEHIQKNFFDPRSGVYFKSVTVRKPDYVWLQSVMFSNLVAAARVRAGHLRPAPGRLLHGARRLLGFEGQDPRLRSRAHPRQRQRQVL